MEVPSSLFGETSRLNSPPSQRRVRKQSLVRSSSAVSFYNQQFVSEPQIRAAARPEVRARAAVSPLRMHTG